ncbi:MAG: hypothetical protein F6J92_09405 [Symploca sp. SIO1A3]|nr:hypothetical protein [Symploca sp. SIO1A3]
MSKNWNDLSLGVPYHLTPTTYHLVIDNLFNPINNDIRGSKSNIAGKNPNGRSMDTNRLATLSITFRVV